MPQRHVFFSPHPDDACLSCGGWIDLLAARGRRVQIITVFSATVSDLPSAFARHLLSKWDLNPDASERRMEEDLQAFEVLGVREWEHWGLRDAPYRTDEEGTQLYASYEELRGAPATQDRGVFEGLCQRAGEWVDARSSERPILYFPLAMGGHVDHQHCFRLGLQLRARGHRVVFYEDWPYVERYKPKRGTAWRPVTAVVKIEAKIRAALRYRSQLKGLGGDKLPERMKCFMKREEGGFQEKYWRIGRADAAMVLHESLSTAQPATSTEGDPLSLSLFRRFADTFRWHDLEEVLPPGSGICIDLGCGEGRHEATVRRKGFQWMGLDVRPGASPNVVLADAASSPFRPGCASAVVAWQVLEYARDPQRIFAGAAELLEPGGVFCGSVSFLEPLHGHSYYNLSHLALKDLLSRHGFADVEVRPGLSGFALLLWTWLRRSAGAGWARLALPVVRLCFLAPAGLIFLLSWLSWRLGMGTGHHMRWLAITAPLEFAGHLMFVARKRGRSNHCT